MKTTPKIKKSASTRSSSAAIKAVRTAITRAGVEETIVVIAPAEGAARKRVKKCLVGRVPAGRNRRAGPGGRRKGDEPVAPPKIDDPALGLLGAISHPQRFELLRIAIRLGSMSHADLHAATGLAPGPLYHHLRPMIASGILRQSARNRYEVAETGRILVALVNAIDQYTRRSRRNGQGRSA